MKILSTSQIRALDQATIQAQGIASHELMERAVRKCTEWFTRRFDHRHGMVVFCGPGNNGGDGLCLARQLAERGYSCLAVYLTQENTSADWQIQWQALQEVQGQRTSFENFIANPKLEEKTVLVDALLGSGLNKPLSGMYADAAKWINAQTLPVVAIDTPSGLSLDHAADVKQLAIRADYTLVFQQPRLGLFIPENDVFLGQWELLDIGLSVSAMEAMAPLGHWITKQMVGDILKPRARFVHKGHFGHVGLVAGAEGTRGAALLSARAALRTGAGKLTLMSADSLQTPLNVAVPEAMFASAGNGSFITHLPKHVDVNVFAAGPGMGRHEQAANVVKELIQNGQPLVLDADALYHLAENPTWFHFLNAHTVLSPHLGEWIRLAGKQSNTLEYVQATRHFAQRYGCTVVLKMACTFIACADGSLFVSSGGNAGLAKAGSGDTLTGIIAALQAQGYTPKQAAIAGVYLHAKAADLALRKQSAEALLASDVIEHLGQAYQFVMGQ